LPGSHAPVFFPLDLKAPNVARVVTVRQRVPPKEACVVGLLLRIIRTNHVDFETLDLQI